MSQLFLFAKGVEKGLGRITALRTNRGRSGKMRLLLDDRPAIELEAEVFVKEAPRVGQEISEERLAELEKLNLLQRCYNTASRLLGYRPRSEMEIKQRLIRRGFDSSSIEATIARLKKENLLDDAAFARFWKENRDDFSPRGANLTRLELYKKGVAAETVGQIVNEEGEGERACRAGQKKAGQLANEEFDVFRRRLGEYLKRRGFGYETIKETVNRLWQEKTSDESN